MGWARMCCTVCRFKGSLESISTGARGRLGIGTRMRWERRMS